MPASKSTTKKKTSSSGKKPVKKSTSASSSTRSKASEGTAVAASRHIEPGYNTLGRAITASVLIVIGFITGIGYFKTDALLVNAFRDFFKGITGWGMFIMPVVLVLGGILLLVRIKKPFAVLRTVCTLLIPVMFGGIVHIFKANDISLTKGALGILWDSGKELTSGGVIAGGLSSLLIHLISKAGTFIVLFLLLALFVFVASEMSFRSTVKSAAESIKTSADTRRETRAAAAAAAAEHEPEPIPIAPDPVHEEPKKPVHRRSSFDIPVDDGPFVRPDDDIPEPEVTVSEPSLFDDGPPISWEPDPEPEEIPPWEKETEIIPSIRNVTSVNFADAPDNAKPKAEKKTASKAEKAPKDTEQKKEEAVPAEPFEIPETDAPGADVYTFPPLDLLPEPEESSALGDGTSEARTNTERLENAFRSFGITLSITGYTRGPSVTRYEAELEAGTKLSKLTNLEDDIALALGSSGVRIAAMPNKIATVGIEVPNRSVRSVLLREIIDSAEFKNSNSKLSFAIGKNISGDSIVGNISKLPHLLVAGTTGSGKSVFLNSLILSILYKAKPDEVKFIMVDPKMVEFKIYSGIPQLLVPVVTEAKKAAGALQWAVVEMLKRYRYFSDENARDIQSYNAIMRSREDGKPMYQLVVVIDELADLMMMAAKDVEESICRIAQMGRAAGIHLVIATQSPRSDVITGLMKANIPSRIALKVSSSLESRIILDVGGAEKLLGNGDMLYMPIGSSKPLRVQGTWVSDEERENVINYIKGQSETQYSEEAISGIDKVISEKENAKGVKNDDSEPAASDFDELLPQAVEITLDAGQASTSMLQRKLKLGYSRAARIVDQMEEIGVIGPFEGSKPRQLLITRQQWQEMQFVNGTAPIEKIQPDESLNADPDDEE